LASPITTGSQLGVYNSGTAVWTTAALSPDGSLVAADRGGLIFELCAP
jgi:hypothetical protein